MHNLLSRQIRRHFGDSAPSTQAWQQFLDAVNEAYEQFDRDRVLLERSLELSAQDVLEANSKLRAAFDAFPDVLLRLDAGGKVIDCTMGRLTQLPVREQVLGKPVRDVLQWGDAAALERTIDQVHHTKEIACVESSLLDGDRGYSYEARIAPLLDDQTIVIIRDISERRRAEEELRARTRQQAAVAALGQRGLGESDLSVLLDEAVALIADTLGTDHCTVWELQPDGQLLVVRAGVGWSQGSARQARLDLGGWLAAAVDSFLSGEPLVVEDYRTDPRFGGAPLAGEHGVMSG